MQTCDAVTLRCDDVGRDLGERGSPSRDARGERDLWLPGGRPPEQENAGGSKARGTCECFGDANGDASDPPKEQRADRGDRELHDDPDAEEVIGEELTEAGTAHQTLAELHRDERPRLEGAETEGQARGGGPVRRISLGESAEPDRHDGREPEDDRHVAGEMQVRVPRIGQHDGTPRGVGDHDEVGEEMADEQAHEREGERGKVAEMASLAHGTAWILRVAADGEGSRVSATEWRP
jgi:hypothetical protein